MPWRSVAVELGQPAAGAAHVQEHDAILEAVEDDVAAVIGNRGPHARIEQLLDGLDGILVFRGRSPRRRRLRRRARLPSTGAPDM